ncbi:MAG: hypothetical protein FNT15_04250 [Sulfurovum sp.]|jgi:hypothetical protein|nr:MAG: hypothetical protein FNT15_04250 [Sulfurovum sp.]
MNKLEKIRPSIDDIDVLIQKEIAQKIYKYIGEKNLFVWKSSVSVKRDIGGTNFNICHHCGGEKKFVKGYQDYDSTTEQHINCKLCGWEGYRLIRYHPLTLEGLLTFRKSICLDWINLKEKKTVKKYFNCEPIRIMRFYVDWKEHRVFFELLTLEYEKVVEVLDFETAHKVFVLFELYNKEVQVESLDHLLSQATLNYNES